MAGMTSTLVSLVMAGGLLGGCAQHDRGMHGGMAGMQGGQGMQGMQMGPDNTPGWAMMSPPERDAHRRKMMEAKSPAECRAHADQHRREMTERARASGTAMEPPRHDMCDMMMRSGAPK